MTDSMRDGFEDITSSAARKLREEADAAAELLSDATGDVRERLRHGADAMQDGMHRARKRLDGASSRVAGAVRESGEYFREHGPRGILKDVEGLVREHPGKALLSMAAIGFLIGRSLRDRE